MEQGLQAPLRYERPACGVCSLFIDLRNLECAIVCSKCYAIHHAACSEPAPQPPPDTDYSFYVGLKGCVCGNKGTQESKEEHRGG